MNLQPLLSLDPTILLLDFCLLLIPALLIYAIVMSIISLQEIKNYPLQKAQHIEQSSRKDVIMMSGGMILGDVLFWVILKNRLNTVLSFLTLVEILVAVDLFFLFFIGWNAMNVLLARKRIRNLFASLPNALPSETDGQNYKGK